MKYLLLPFLLLLAVEAWAGDNTEQAANWIQSPWWGACTSPVINQRCWIYMDKETGPHIIVRDDKDVSCLAQMEAAMRAMEPYLDKWTYETDGSLSMRLDEPIAIPYFSTDHSDPRMNKILKQRNQEHGKAVEQWTTTKRECWKGQ